MFGSSATGLAHCGSDLDLVVCAGTETRRSRPPPAREWLSAMKGCLKGWQLCSKIETVPNAKVNTAAIEWCHFGTSILIWDQGAMMFRNPISWALY